MWFSCTYVIVQLKFIIVLKIIVLNIHQRDWLDDMPDGHLQSGGSLAKFHLNWREFDGKRNS